MSDAEQRDRLRGLGLFPHQVDFIQAALSLGAGARAVLADGVGLGKTTSLCALISEMERETDRALRVLVVAPLALLSQWASRLSDGFGIGAIVMNIQGLRALEAGVNADQNLWLGTLKVIVNPEFLMHDQRFVATLEASWDLLILDEVVTATAGSLKRHMITEMWRSERVGLVVASVASANTMHFVDPSPDLTFARQLDDIRDWDGRTLFQRNDVDERIVIPLTDEEIDLLSTVRELSRNASRPDPIVSLRDRAASSLLALEQTLRRLSASRIPGEARVHETAAEETDAEPDSRPFSANRVSDDVINRLLALLENVPSDSKLAALVALVMDPNQPAGPCIIFTDYRDTADYIVDQLQLAGVGRVVDSVAADRHPHESEEAVRRVMEHDGVLVATTAACKGFEFGSAGLVIHYDVPRSANVMTIRMSRVNRLSTPYGNVRVVSLVDEVFNNDESAGQW